MEASEKGTSVSDARKALYAAVILEGLALLFVFGANPGGFETQGALLPVLLPASLVAYPLSDVVYAHAPQAERIVFWTIVIAFNFLWYWLLSSIAIKIRRALG